MPVSQSNKKRFIPESRILSARTTYEFRLNINANNPIVTINKSYIKNESGHNNTLK
jgi:hypothetical protein